MPNIAIGPGDEDDVDLEKEDDLDDDEEEDELLSDDPENDLPDEDFDAHDPLD